MSQTHREESFPAIGEFCTIQSIQPSKKDVERKRTKSIKVCEKVQKH